MNSGASDRTHIAQPGRSTFGLVCLLVCLSVTSYFQRTSMSIAGPGMAREFGFTETELGSIYSAFLLGYTLLRFRCEVLGRGNSGQYKSVNCESWVRRRVRTARR